MVSWYNKQCLIPVVMSGIIAVYALVISVLIATDLAPPMGGSGAHYSLFKYALPQPHPHRRAPSELAGGKKRANTEPHCSGFMHLACGLSVGLTGLAAGYCIGVVGDKGVRAYMEQSRVFVGMVLILIFGEVLGLYG